MSVSQPAFTAVSLVVLLVALCIAIPLMVRLFGGRRGSDSILKATGVTLLICFVLLFGVKVAIFESHKEATVNVTFDSVEMKQPGISSGPGKSSPNTNTRPVITPSVETGVTPTSLSGADENVMWVPLSDEILADLISPEGAKALAQLNKSLPPEFRQAYAMIPLSAAGPRVTTPVLNQALASPVIADALASDPVQAAVAGLFRMIQSSTPADDRGEQVAELPESAEFQPPSWINNPGLGRVVVKSDFQEASVPAETALRPAIADALREKVVKTGSRRFGADEEWGQYLDIRVSDEALAEFIVETAKRREVLATVDGPRLMQQTYALVEISDDAEMKVLTDMKQALQQDRAIILGLTIGGLWLAAVLLGFAIRASQSGSFIRKIAIVPLLSLMVLPCLLLSVAMTAAMIDGKTVSFSIRGERVVCSVDAESVD